MDGLHPTMPLFPLTTPSPSRASAHSPSPTPSQPSVNPSTPIPRGGGGGDGAEARDILGAMTSLGKRHRTNSSMRRTTSMSGFDVPAEEAGRQPTRVARGASAAPTMGWSAASAAMQRRHSGDFNAVMETAAFLKACGLCCRRLGPGRDTFIYMGEVAFCSLECRQHQMNLDDLKDKKCFPAAGTGGSDGTSGTVAAA